MATLTFHESYGTMPESTLRLIKAANVSPADWDMMLARWGYNWNDDLPWELVEQHIESHRVRGMYQYPMYG